MYHLKHPIFKRTSSHILDTNWDLVVQKHKNAIWRHIDLPLPLSQCVCIRPGALVTIIMILLQYII